MPGQAYVSEQVSGNKPEAQTHNHDIHAHYIKSEEGHELPHEHFSTTPNHHSEDNTFTRYR